MNISAHPPPALWAADALREWLGGRVPSAPGDPSAAGEAARFLERQRLEVLASGWGFPLVPVREVARRTLFHQTLLKEGADLARRLGDAGIPCLCLRGPFAAATLYPEPADRPFRDLDLLVPRPLARKALPVARASGFRHHSPHMPAGYFLRNHLHWMMIRDRDGIVCDLHWAVEHKFRPYRVDPDAVFASARRVEWRGLSWSQPCPEHAFLLSALHARKHLPSTFDPADLPGLLFAPGCLFQWLDLALLARGALDWDQVARSAAAWNLAPVLGLSLRVLRQGLGLGLPPGLAAFEALAGSAVPAPVPAWTARLTPPGLERRVCVRAAKVQDACEYIRRPHSSGRMLPTLARRAGACLRVGAAAADTLACVAWAGLAERISRRQQRKART